MRFDNMVNEVDFSSKTLYTGQLPRAIVQGEMNTYSGFGREEYRPNYEIVGSQDTRRKISDTSVAPFRYICQLLMNMSDGKFYIGTGFFIGPKTILTAGHNIWDDLTNAKLPNNKIWISAARNGATLPFGTINPVNVIPSHGGFSSADFSTSKDYAILHLAHSLGNTTGYFGQGKWAKDATGSQILSTNNLPVSPSKLQLNLCGYPGDKGGDLQYSSYNMGFALQDGGTILSYFNDTKGGHSGSPVWIKRHSSLGGRIIVGIHIARGPFATSPAGTVKYNRAVFINNNVRAFIRANLQ